jgi:RNase P subunit RPR2
VSRGEEIASSGAIMLDAFSRASRYAELADAYLKLSELTADDDIRAHYCKISENYLVMARAELARAEQERIRKQSQQ